MSYAYYPTGNVKTVRLGNNVTIDYTYHISGAVKTATAKNADGKKLFEEELYYEDCGNHNCVPQYNGNISYMVHELAANGEQKRSSKYVYDFMNRLTSVEDSEQDMFNEYFKYDEQGRIVSQRRGQGRGGDGATGGEYGYYANTNRLEKVSGGMGGMSAANRDMSASENFVYDAEGNLIEDKSKNLKISYDWRGMPVEFRMESKSGNVLENTRSCSRDSVRVLMAYDGSGRRVSKTRERKACISETSSGATSERTYAADWERELVTHYTGIGTEVRESFHNGSPSETKVVVNMPQGLGRYGVEDATDPFKGIDKDKLAGYIPSAKFEWFLKNHLGSTMLVYGSSAYNDPFNSGYKGGVKAAYDYRAFGEQVSLAEPTDKVTENFTGKELDDETDLNYFGARYLDPMLGMWTSVDPARQFASPYLYAGNGVNPIGAIDPDGNETHIFLGEGNEITEMQYNSEGSALAYLNYFDGRQEVFAEPAQGSYFYAKSNGIDFDVVGESFDFGMNSNANVMMNSWFNENKWTEFREWGSGGLYDFKSQFYKGAENTVGIVNGTIMTARDAGNALWGGVASYQYGLTWLGMHVASDAAAGWGALSKQGRKMQIYGAIGCGVGRGTCEDYTSRSMQDWGYSRDFGKPR
ncbi:RHS repeat-associated core domain-containing protein [Fibrobacter sp. UWH6]|uniref:RHS repeat-associated core domain-containing protein n=1 Tax=Fibrobacter sp. (strain UWH6) TaxID=1896212 RepID=UPI000914A51E|nr:RHS repeat-associated core domain-containing protein [Fibrobacter sp. UWH6]SHK96698.1 RHS repeat-associated core domain-containing protein [Fibrobacter sp. UWH6]